MSGPVVREQDNPFRPGRGVSPPCLAGREFEQECMSHILRLTARKQPSGQDIVLIGPRGSGKTVLLSWLDSRADEANVDVIQSTPDQIPDLNRLAEASVSPSRLEKLLRDGLAVSLGNVVDGKWNLKAATPLAQALAARCRERPVLLTIDEAHMLAQDVARVLLNLSQLLHRSGSLLMLTMAGTFELARTLKDAGATFWERYQMLGIGLLAPEAAIKARWDRGGLQGAIGSGRRISSPAAAFEGLRDLGFVWRAPGETVYAAGIASLMDFVEQSFPNGGSNPR